METTGPMSNFRQAVRFRDGLILPAAASALGGLMTLFLWHNLMTLFLWHKSWNIPNGGRSEGGKSCPEK
jgi:hypothetical protein